MMMAESTAIAAAEIMETKACLDLWFERVDAYKEKLLVMYQPKNPELVSVIETGASK